MKLDFFGTGCFLFQCAISKLYVYARMSDHHKSRSGSSTSTFAQFKFFFHNYARRRRLISKFIGPRVTKVYTYRFYLVNQIQFHESSLYFVNRHSYSTRREINWREKNQAMRLRAHRGKYLQSIHYILQRPMCCFNFFNRFIIIRYLKLVFENLFESPRQRKYTNVPNATYNYVDCLKRLARLCVYTINHFSTCVCDNSCVYTSAMNSLSTKGI